MTRFLGLDNRAVRQLFDRWRLTLIGCPLLGVLAYVVTGRLDYAALVVVLSALVLRFLDTVVSGEVEQSDEKP